MLSAELAEYTNTNKRPDIAKRNQLKDLIDKYPYFQAGIFWYLKCLFNAEDPAFRKELQRLAIFIIDKRALFYYIFSKEYEAFFSCKGDRKELKKSRTDILLNAFFETMDDSAIDFQIERSVMNPNMVYSDYFSYLKSLETKENESIQDNNTEDSNQLKHQNIIDDFIKNTSGKTNILFTPEDGKEIKVQKEEKKENLSEELQDDLFFTETLANIYIKQKKYERAYEIIKRLSLNFPEKNIYFANQISFLEKLIINKNSKK